MNIGILTLHIQIHGCSSLKEKRSHIKPLIARIHREFNVSTSEIDMQDKWQETMIACAIVSNNMSHNRLVLQTIGGFITTHFPDLYIISDKIETI